MAAFAATVLSSTDAMAQGGGRRGRGQGGGGQGGNFDPAAMQQRMLDSYKTQFAVTDENEWKVISAAIVKVTEARRDLGTGRGGMGGIGGRRNQNQQAADTTTQDANAAQGRRGRGGFGGTPMPEAEALQKAIADNVASDEIKAKIIALRSARQSKQATLDKAMDDLKKLLNAKQEGVALLAGLVR